MSGTSWRNRAGLRLAVSDERADWDVVWNEQLVPVGVVVDELLGICCG